MTRLGPPQVGLFLETQAPELTRIWRIARAQARTGVFPGLIDDLVQGFFERAGHLVAAGGRPEEVWSGLVGALRCHPGLGSAEITQEWAVLLEVLAAACESVNAEAAVGEWLTRAAAAAESGSVLVATHGAGHAPGIARIVLFESALPRYAIAAPEDPADG